MSMIKTKTVCLPHLTTTLSQNKDPQYGKIFDKGTYESYCEIPENFLNEELYFVSFLYLRLVQGLFIRKKT